MLKKVMMFLVFGMAVTDVWAASSIPNAGGNTVQPMVQNMPQVRKAGNNATLARTAKTPTVANNSLGGRLVAIPVYSFGNMKQVKNPVNKTTGSTTPSGNTNTQDLTDLSDRINLIQVRTENMITDVVSNAGTYVTDVTVDGNTLNVNKTRLLYAPVRNSSGDAITGEAEIWIVR